MTDSTDASAALEAVQAARAKLVAASDAPPARHFAFAGLMGALVAAPGIPLPERFAVFVLILVGVALVVQWDKRRTGMFINGYRAGKTRMATAVVLLVCLSLYAVSSWWSLTRQEVWPCFALGVVALIPAYFGSQWWCRIFRREMAEL